MKGPVAAMICAGAFVPREQFNGTIAVSASVGEEELEGPALAAILKQQPADVVIIGESSERRWRRPARARRHPHRSARRAGALFAPRGGRQRRVQDARSHRARARAARTDRPGADPWHSEVVEIVSSPYPGTSIVPDGCRVRIDRRLVRGETRESVLAMFREALRGIDGVDVRYMQVALPCYTGETIVSDDFHPAWVTPRDSDLVKRAEKALASAGLPVDYFASRYCANGSASAGEMNIPTLIFGPSTPALAHIVDEYIEVEQLVRGTEAYMAISVEVLR